MENLTNEESLNTQMQDAILEAFWLLKLLDGYCAHNPEDDSSAIYISSVLGPAVKRLEEIIEKF